MIILSGRSAIVISIGNILDHIQCIFLDGIDDIQTGIVIKKIILIKISNIYDHIHCIFWDGVNNIETGNIEYFRGNPGNPREIIQFKWILDYTDSLQIW